VQYVQNCAEIRVLFPGERAIEACPFGARTAHELCNVVLSGGGPDGMTNVDDVAGLERGIDAFRDRSAARSRSGGSLCNLFRRGFKQIGRAVCPAYCADKNV
jgi:hypothetical protein